MYYIILYRLSFKIYLILFLYKGVAIIAPYTSENHQVLIPIRTEKSIHNMSIPHIPQDSKILSCFKDNEGEYDKLRLMLWLQGGILSCNLGEINEAKSQIVEFYKDGKGKKNRSADAVSNANDLGQKLCSISNLLGKIRNQWENMPTDVTEEEYKKLTDALITLHKYKDLWKDYKCRSEATSHPSKSRNRQKQKCSQRK